MMALLLLVMVMIEALDFLTGREWSLWVLYLGPIGLAGWLNGFGMAKPLVLVAIALQLVEALLVGHIYSSWAVFLFVVSCRGFCYFLVGYLCGRVKQIKELECTVHSYENLCDSLHVDLAPQSALFRSGKAVAGKKPFGMGNGVSSQ